MAYLGVELRSAPDRALALLAPAGDRERWAHHLALAGIACESNDC